MPSFVSASVALAMLFFTACSLNDRQLSKEYAGPSLQGKTLAMILVDTAQVDVENPRELSAAFPPPPDGAGRPPFSPKAVLAREFNDYFYREMVRGMDYVTPIRVADTLPPPADSETVSYTRKAALGVPAFTYAIPSRAYLRAHGVEADLALVVSRLQSSLGKIDVTAPEVGGAVREKYLRVEGWFIVWDYAGNRPVSNGRFRPNQVYGYDPKTKDWQLAFDQDVKLVLETTPFRGGKKGK